MSGTHRLILPAIVILVTALLMLTTSALADDAAPPESPVKVAGRVVTNELKRYVHDAKDLSLAPVRWNDREWLRFGEGTAAVLALYAADRPLYDAVQRNRSSFSDRFAKDITPWGAHRALEMSALLIVGGAIAHDPDTRDAGRDSLESQFWAAGVVTPILKRAFGRARPVQEQGEHSFHPFSSQDQSFPSGHATNAFAFATAVAAHYETWIVPTIVYTMAAGVSVSRVNDRAHFPSDVLAGALIGRAVAKGIVSRHQHARLTWTVTPTIVGNRPALLVHMITR